MSIIVESSGILYFNTKAAIPCFENSFGYIDNESIIGRNLKPAFLELLNFSASVRESYQSVEKDFIAIINELMKNTYEWGKTDRYNVTIDPSIRGVFSRFFRRVRSKAVKEFMFHKGLQEYFADQRLQENGIQELYFIEISVFDSGAGFVEKYQGKRDANVSDIDIVKTCLIKHRTSALGLEKGDKGIGLDRILHLLNNRGFLRIKTNKTCVYRNLISHPYKNSQDARDMELFDWATHSSANYTTSPDANGSVVTIIYPLAINLTR